MNHPTYQPTPYGFPVFRRLKPAPFMKKREIMLWLTSHILFGFFFHRGFPYITWYAILIVVYGAFRIIRSRNRTGLAWRTRISTCLTM